MAKFAVLLLAAGQSTRFGNQTGKKPFVSLAGQPVWMHSVHRFLGRDDVCQVVIVVAPDDRADFQSRFGANLLFMGADLCEGGDERSDSVRNGLAAINDEATHVAIHDTARPCVTEAAIDAVFAAAANSKAAILATPVAATLKRGDGDPPMIRETVPRDGLWAAQTPQAFERGLIERAHSHGEGATVTDDAQLVEQLGEPVTLVPGSPENLKITTPDDLRLAEAILAARQPGKSAKRPAPTDDEADLWG